MVGFKLSNSWLEGIFIGCTSGWNDRYTRRTQKRASAPTFQKSLDGVQLLSLPYRSWRCFARSEQPGKIVQRQRPSAPARLRVSDVELRSFLVKPLFKIRRGAYGSPAYLSGRHRPDSPAALRDHSCITTRHVRRAD